MSDKCYNRECTDGENSDSGCKRFNADADMERYCPDYMYDPIVPLAAENIIDLEKQVAALTTERDTLKGQVDSWIKRFLAFEEFANDRYSTLETERDTLREKNALLRRVITNIIESMTDKRFCYIDRCYSAVTICGSDECIDQFMEEPTEEQE